MLDSYVNVSGSALQCAFAALMLVCTCSGLPYSVLTLPLPPLPQPPLQCAPQHDARWALGRAWLLLFFELETLIAAAGLPCSCLLANSEI